MTKVRFNLCFILIIMKAVLNVKLNNIRRIKSSNTIYPLSIFYHFHNKPGSKDINSQQELEISIIPTCEDFDLG